jgi:hypothetical protein
VARIFGEYALFGLLDRPAQLTLLGREKHSRLREGEMMDQRKSSNWRPERRNARSLLDITRSRLNEDALNLSKGDRVHLSKLGCLRHPRDGEKKGTVVGPTQYPNSLRIVWDGSRWPIAIHRDYFNSSKKRSPMPMDDQVLPDSAENAARRACKAARSTRGEALGCRCAVRSRIRMSDSGLWASRPHPPDQSFHPRFTVRPVAPSSLTM